MKRAIAIDLRDYIKNDEKFISFGEGGSEALVLFLKSLANEDFFVRKILSEKLTSAYWNRKGKGTMTPPFKKALLQFKYLQGLPDEVALYFPKVCNIKKRRIPINSIQGKKNKKFFYEVLYDEEYVGGMEVSSFIALYKPPPIVVAHLYKEIFLCLKEKFYVHRKQRNNICTINKAYFEKIKKRLKISRTTAPGVFNKFIIDSEFIRINGKKYLNTNLLLRKLGSGKFPDILKPPHHCLVMGDTNTENIKITNINPILQSIKNEILDFSYDEIGIKFLDPRAIGFNSCGSKTVDDYMYDNKPFHNSLGNYDAIHGEYFDLSISYDASSPKIKIKYFEKHPFKKSYKNIERYFEYIIENGWDVSNPKHLHDDPYWLIRFVFIMGTHFLAMPPFHFSREQDGSLIDDYIHQKRPIALYCEGIKWLNLALDMLDGKVKKFNGFLLPKLPEV